MGGIVRVNPVVLISMAVVFLALCGTAFAAPSVPCHTAFSANTIYTFNESANISGSYCFAVAADNVTINCAGKSITGSNTSVGIQSTSFNTTVENCNISNFSIGIDYIGANNGMILNVTASTTDASSPAIYLSSSNYTVIANSTATAINGHAITVGSSSDYNTVCNNTLISSSGTGTLLSVDSSIGNRFYWNNFTDTGSSYATDSNPAGSNFYNATTPNGTNEGNIWYNVMNGSVQALGANHSAGFPPLYIGIAGTGLPYGVTSSLAKVNIGVVDYAPLTSRQALQCGALSAAGATYNLSANVSISGASCFNVTAANITLDCNGFGMAGNNSSSTSGVYSNQFNTTVRNCQISNFSTGIYFSGATNGTIQNTSINITQTITDKDVHGIYFYNGANYNRIIGSSAYASSGYGIFLRSGSSFNTITASSATTDTNNAIYIYSNSNNNTFNRSNATNAGHMSVCIETSSRNTFTNGQITGKQATYGALSINWGSANNTVSNSAINGNGGNYAATLMAGSNTGNRFINNTILNATTLIHLDSGAGINAFHWNNFTAATTYVDDANGSNYYNATISGRGEGNIWANVMDGSVEITGTDNSTGFPLLRIGTAGTGYPYNNSTSGGKLSGAAVDYAPLTSAAPAASSCKTLSTPNNVTTLASNVSINGQTCFNVTAENVTLDCNGFGIRGNNASGTYGIYSNQLNTTIRNCNVSNFNDAIGSYNTAGTRILDSSASSSACNVLALYNATGAVVQNVNATKIGTACSVIAIAYGSNTVVENSTLIGVNGVWTDGSTMITGTRIVNNTFSCPASLQCINFGAKSSGSMVALNNFSGAGTYVIDNNGSNYYNYTVYGINQGNIYENVVNGSVSITGSSASSVPGFSVGTTGTGYPYNGTTSAGKFSCGFAGCGDYAPLTAAPLLNCSNLTAAGTTYKLFTPASINGATCFNVQAANITLNCAGFSMLGNNSTRTYGVYSNQFNTTIKNCQISNFSTGIYLNGATNGTIRDSSVGTTYESDSMLNGNGIYLANSANYNTIANATVTSISRDAIRLVSSSYNTIADSTATADSYAISLSSSSGNTIANTTATATTQYAIILVSGSNNAITNSTGTTTDGDAISISSSSNNIITNSTGASESGYGISISSSSNTTIASSTATSAQEDDLYFTPSDSLDCANNFTGVTGTGGKPILYYGNAPATVSNNDTSLIILCNASYSSITGSNATKGGIQVYYTNNSNFSGITGISGPRYGIYLISSSNNAIADASATANDAAIYLALSFNNTLTNSTATSNNTDIYIEGPVSSCSGENWMCGFFSSDKESCEALNCTWASIAGNNAFTNNTVTGGTHGFHVSEMTNTTFIGNAIKNNSLDGVYLDSASSGNTFYWNNFTGTSGVYVNDANGGNHYNTTISGHGEGNIWANVMDGRVAITGTSNSTGFPSLRYGTNGSGYPYGNSTSERMFSCNYAGCADYAPLTDPGIVPNVIGNGLSINVSGPSLNASVSIGGSSGDVNGTRQNGTKTVNITNSGTGRPLFVFGYRFTNASLNFSGVRVEEGTSGGMAYASISGINSSNLVGGKTLYMYNASTTINSVCVKDEEDATYASISSTCTASDETIVTCDGANHSGYTCAYNGTTAIITGLLHSAAIQFAPAAPGSSPSGGSGNNGGGSSGTYYPQQQQQNSTPAAECASFTYETCPQECVVCPPCAACSSISCQTQAFCANIGFNRSWYESTKSAPPVAPTAPEQPSVWIPSKLPATPAGQPAAPIAAQSAQADNGSGMIGTALMLGAIVAVAGALFFFAWKGRKKHGL